MARHSPYGLTTDPEASVSAYEFKKALAQPLCLCDFAVPALTSPLLQDLEWIIGLILSKKLA